LQRALVRFCEEYPSSANGLTRSQQNIAEAVAQGARTKDDIFKRSQAREEAAFLGDAPCFRKIAELGADPSPLIVELDQGYELTVLGHRVVAGEADWLESQPLDRWIGGVHLSTEQHWRWDEISRAFVKRAA